MKRKIVHIDADKCNGCGQCVSACAEGAIELVGGKARLVSDVYCDGLGACLGECPAGAITIKAREAGAFDAAAVERRLKDSSSEARRPAEADAKDARPVLPCGCPGSAVRQWRAAKMPVPRVARLAGKPCAATGGTPMPRLAAGGTPALQAAGQTPVLPERPSQLGQWPVQLALLPPRAPYFQDADLLIAADCVPFALADFHERFLTGKVLAIACPKLDNIAPQVEKLAAIFAANDIRSVTVVHMEVPCCRGIVQAVRAAMERAGKSSLPFRDATVGLDGTTVSAVRSDSVA